MLKIKYSDKFKKDINQYKKDIENIPNERVRKECYNLLSNLLQQYSLVDEAHNPLTNKTINPVKVKENVQTGIDIRKRLNKIIKDSKS